MTPASRYSRRAWMGLLAAALVPSMLACEVAAPREPRTARPAQDDDRAAPYQADVEEGLGAAVAILVDTSGSMRQDAPGESRPKHEVAQQALEAMLDATDAFIAKRPDFPIKIGLYSFSSNVRTLMPIRPYNRAEIRSALRGLPRAG